MGPAGENHAVTRRAGAMHIETARSHQTLKDGTERVYQRHLLRRSYREGGRVKKQTLANLSHLPDELIELIRAALRGERFVAAGQAFQIERSLPAGHIEAALAMARRLDLARLLDRSRS